MRTFEQISNILISLSDEAFERLGDDWYDMIMLDGKERRNARKRFLYRIKKLGISEEEYNYWESV